jgi:predicted RND superfamily exporter protein
MKPDLPAAYDRIVLGRPRTTLTILFLLLAFFSYHSKDFRLDASADSLLLEDDKDLQLFREVSARYQTQDLLIVTFTPDGDLFSDDSLSHLGRLRDELGTVGSVASVMTILDVPLVQSADVPLLELADNVQTLETSTVDRVRARQELSESPVYRDLVLSRDTRTTALLVNVKDDKALSALLEIRNDLSAKRRAGRLSRDERQRLKAVSVAYEDALETFNDRRHEDIARIRSILDGYRPYGVLHLGGVPMIADDMVTFVKNDLIIFGSGVLVFLVVVLTVIFGQLRWVVLPLLSCFYAGMTMIGMLGLIGWNVTVISSNFLSLMLIITISMNIHLVVRYRQLLRDVPEATHAELVSTTVRKMVWPCLYTALTTIIGFSSLVFSDIKPVIDFGWMMSIGLSVTFLTSFSLFPAALVLAGKPALGRWKGREFQLPMRLATFTERHGNAILVSAVLLVIVSGVGIARLTVENSFIDYFSRDTEIYRGMKLIDEQLGGTTPLDVLLDLDTDRMAGGAEIEEADAEDEDEYLDDWDIDVAAEPAYWFTPFKIERIKQVHDYLDSLPEVGKVLSLASIVRVAEELNEGKEFDGLELSVLYKKLPTEIKEPMIDPYVSIEHDEARIFLRIVDSQEGLRRNELLERIRADLSSELSLGEGDVRVTGTLVLYDNMLQSLYTSQISTLAAVMVGIAIMLLVLFRSAALAIIGIAPNLLAAGMVLGLMGLAGIPLDMMTITIAAITIGIAVDNAIHYIYRFREEFPQSGDYIETLRVCHASIGRAVLYTSTTIIFGFSILVLSNFFPTIYFGVLTGLAMLIALLAALTLLPKLILVWRPFSTSP